jgi:hypothetical protein
MNVGSTRLTSVANASEDRSRSVARRTVDVTSANDAQYTSHSLPKPPEKEGTESGGVFASKSWKKSTSLETMTRLEASLFA